MNFSIWAVWAAQGSKGKNQFEYFLAPFEGGFSTLHGQKNLKILLCSVCTKKVA